jgi:pyruvate dehydrogenase E2 component (dihydrolipoamide acetyltransferase)/2-oxoglutarate dehydrogenase E2 component (dihydrolipoamide succinyltransferase)
MVTLITVPRYIALLKNYASKPTITQWLKGNGQSAKKGETLVIVETTKTSLEIEAPATGLVFILKEVREKVKIGDIIGVIASSQETFDDYRKQNLPGDAASAGGI